METAPPTTGLAPDQREKTAGKLLAYLAGAFILLIATPFSLGASLFAPLAMLIASTIWRHRGSKLSTLGHWVAAACGAAIAFLLFAGMIRSLSSKGSWSQMKQLADSAQKASAKEPPPAWLEKIAPGVAARSAAAKPPSERAQKVTLAFGAAIGLFFFVAFFGSLGWAGGMLLGYGVNGQWPGTGARAPAANSATSSLV